MNDDDWFSVTDEQYEIARKNGIPRKRVNDRINKSGWDIDRAITTPVKERKNRYEAWKEICEQNGISRSTFNKRLAAGWTEKRAASTPFSNKLGRERIFDDELVRKAAQNGITYGDLYRRCYFHQWSPEKAASVPIKHKRKRGEKVKDTQQYAMYKGENLLAIGTLEELSAIRCVKVESIRFYLTQAYRNKLARRKRNTNAIELVLLEKEDDEDEVG